MCVTRALRACACVRVIVRACVRALFCRYCFDDSRVSPVKASSIASAEAYVLYFEMVDGDPPPATKVVQRPPTSDSSDEEADSDEAEVAVPPERHTAASSTSEDDDDDSSSSPDDE